jgi:hexosaminidase
VLPWARYANQPPSGQLDVTKNGTIELVAGIFAELARLFPDPYLHLGADEINAACYEDFVPGYTKANLQTFFDVLFEELAPLNRTAVMWEDAILTHKLRVPPSTVMQIWGEASSATELAKQGHPIIMSPSKEYYLDCALQGGWLDGTRKSWCDPIATSTSMYQFDPNPANLSEIIGGELALWTEVVDGANLMQSIFARALGGAGRFWQSPLVEGGTSPSPVQMRRARVKMGVSRERMVQRGAEASPLWMGWCTDGGYCVDDGPGVVEL